MTQIENLRMALVVRKFAPAALFLLLAVIWDEASTLLRYSFAAGGLAFLLEGIFKLVTRAPKGGVVDPDGGDQ